MNIYPFLLKNVIMPSIARCTDVTIWTDYRDMLGRERLGLDELKRYQFHKLSELLRHAYEKVPFYRQRFDGLGLTPADIRNEEELTRIPPTTKEDIMANFPEGITAQGMDRAKWKYVASSGTTRKIMGIHDFRKANINWAAGLRAHKLAGGHDIGMKWMEIPPHMCTTICGIDDSGGPEKIFSKKLLSLLAKGDLSGVGEHLYKGIYSRRHELYKRVTLPSFGSEGTNIPEHEIASYLDSIDRYRPHLLEGLPLYLYTFAEYLTGKGLPAPKVGVIKPFGGSLTPVMKQSIGTAFGCEVYDTYGCSETGFIACDCAQHDGLHLFMDLYLVEVCRNGKPVAPGELGKLFITDLENRAMPWIRYEIGDVGRYYVDDHGCGRKSMRLQVEGRVEDTLVNSRGELFTSDQVFDFFHSRPDCANFQLVERSRGNFELLCVPTPGVTIERERIALDFKEFFDPAAQVKAYTAKTIKAEDGGKFRFIKSKSFAEL